LTRQAILKKENAGAFSVSPHEGRKQRIPMHVALRTKGHRDHKEEQSTQRNTQLLSAIRLRLQEFTLRAHSHAAPSVSGIGAIGLRAGARLAFFLAAATGASTAVSAPMSTNTATSAPVATNVAASLPVTTNAPIIVTASRANRTASELPANVTVITADAIRDSGAQNVVSALETLGGVFFRRNSDNPGQAEISMRGFGENSFGRVLILLDGQPINNPDMSNPDWLRVPFGSIDRIEVLHGGATALYGNYAVAGVINIITHQPSDQPSTTVSTTIGSDHTFAGHLGHAGSLDGDTRYTADVDWNKSDGWRDYSSYENTDVRASITHDWMERLNTTISAFYTDDHNELPGDLSKSQMDADPRQSVSYLQEDTTGKTFGGSLNNSVQLDADSSIEAALSATRRTIASEYGPPGYPIDTTLDRYAFAPRYLLDTDLAGYRNRLLVGTDLGLDVYRVNAFDDYAHTMPSADAALQRANAGLYLQDEIELTKTISLMLGARQEIYRYSSDVVTNFSSGPSASQNTTYHQYAEDAGLVYRPTDQIRLFGRISTLYHDPFLDELVSTYPGWGPIGMTTGLHPETGLQEELGASTKLADEWTAQLSGYRLDMHDPIFYNPVTGVNENTDPTRRYGMDATLTWVRKDLGLLSATYNYVDATFDRGPYTGNKIPLVPENVVTVHGELELPFDLAALVTVHAIDSQYLGDDYANQNRKIPSYGTLDLGLRYRPAALPGFDLLVGVDNVFDKIYANQGYLGYYGPGYYPAPGRTWKVTASYRF
jgi:iron complex outermembrane receptor protein